MKTLVVWDEFSEGTKLLLFDEDLSRFHNVFINEGPRYDESEEDYEKKEALQNELNAFMYADDAIRLETNEVSWSHPAIFNAADLRIIHCGFIP